MTSPNEQPCRHLRQTQTPVPMCLDCFRVARSTEINERRGRDDDQIDGGGLIVGAVIVLFAAIGAVVIAAFRHV